MKIRKLTSTQLFNIIEDRLTLQSIKRTLECYKLPKCSVNYFQSQEFAQLFKSWDNFKKIEFSKSLAGQYWRNINNILQDSK